MQQLLECVDNATSSHAIFTVGELRGHDLSGITIDDLTRHFKKGDFSYAEYTSFCLKRIHILNPFLEAVIQINPDASGIAERLSLTKELDDRRSGSQISGPLCGIPVLVKDNIATRDNMQTTAGSWALLGSIVKRDATVVSKLRNAGAIILGHSNMSEWASYRSKEASEGYSPRGGQTRNPNDLSKTPFGSSSGSAVAVAANLVPLALGTETDTSIILPASINGVVGIKPTVGMTSRAGVIPISENMDSVGTFGRTVADAVKGLDVIAGPDPRDPFTQEAAFHTKVPFSQFLTTCSSLSGARFGLPRTRCWDLVPEDCKAPALSLFNAMKQAGAEIIDVNLPSVEERVATNGEWDWEHGAPDKCEHTVAKVDAYNGITAYLQNLEQSSVRSIEAILRYNEANDGTEGATAGRVPAFPSGHDRLVEIAESKGVKDDTYYAALKHIQYQTRENGLDAALAGVDALLFCDRKGIGQQYAAQAGYPIICIPIGLDGNGMPVSLSIQHTAWKDAELVKWASAIENLWVTENGKRLTPRYRNWGAKNVPIGPV